MEAKSAHARRRTFWAGVLGAIVLGLVLVPAKPAQAAVITVTALDDFNAAIGAAPTTSDSFSNDIAGGPSITFDSAVVSTLSGGLLTNAAQDNRVSGGVFAGEVDGNGLDAPLLLTWTFPNPVIGVGMDISVIGRLDAIAVGSGQLFDIADTLNARSGFFGLVDAMAPFTQVQFFVFDNSRNDSFTADNLIFAAAPLVLPEPATLALFLLGLATLGLAGIGRRRGPVPSKRDPL